MTEPSLSKSAFIAAFDLAARLAGPVAPALLFVVPEGSAPLPEGLIPGSKTTAVSTHYAGAGGGERGRAPLPDRAFVEAWLAEAGIAEDAPIVVYDTGSGTSAARAWWVLRWAGRAGVFILDGGLPAWAARDDAPATDHRPPPRAPSFEAIDTAAIARDPSAFRLLDARGKAAFEGDGRTPSHLPGAVHAAAAQWQDAQGRLLPYAQRRALAQSLGLLDEGKPVVAYCGSGAAAAYLIAATQDLGVQAALYAGSWSAWSADPQRVAWPARPLKALPRSDPDASAEWLRLPGEAA